MDLDLAGKVVLVTGGSKGIGLACAQGFLAEAARVAIVSRSQHNLDQARGRLGGAVASAEQALGPIDVLVNSAGAARRTPLDDLTPEAWHAAMAAKYFTYIHVIDPVVKRMAARGVGVT